MGNSGEDFEHLPIPRQPIVAFSMRDLLSGSSSSRECIDVPLRLTMEDNPV
jgi:hypothetical protein